MNADVIILDAILNNHQQQQQSAAAIADNGKNQHTETTNQNDNFKNDNNQPGRRFVYSDLYPTRYTKPHDRDTICLCVIQKNETLYLDDWIDYHLVGVGFDVIFIYDNAAPSSDEALHLWDDRNGRIRIISWPHPPGLQKSDKGPQEPAYNDCAARAKALNYTFASFLDVDEYLALYRHETVLDLLHDHLPAGPRPSSINNNNNNNSNTTASAPIGGQLSLRWRMFGFSGQDVHLPNLPVPARFACAAKKHGQDIMSKPIVRLEYFKQMNNGPHCVGLEDPALYYTTMGIKRNKPCPIIVESRPNQSFQVAAIHHYYTRSRQEYVEKRQRGDVKYPAKNALLVKLARQGLDWKKPNAPGNIQATPQPTLLEQTVWNTMKRRIPEKYGMVEQLPEFLQAAQNWTCPEAPYEFGPQADAVREQLKRDEQAKLAAWDRFTKPNTKKMAMTMTTIKMMTRQRWLHTYSKKIKTHEEEVKVWIRKALNVGFATTSCLFFGLIVSAADIIWAEYEWLVMFYSTLLCSYYSFPLAIIGWGWFENYA